MHCSRDSPAQSGWVQPGPPGNAAVCPADLGLWLGQAGSGGSFRVFDAIYVAKCKLPYFKALN